MTIEIARVNSNFEREPLTRPFGFKGGFLSEIWQTVASLQSRSGLAKIGIATQNVLWSDARVFAGFSEAAANSIMYAVTDFALQHVCGMKYDNPIELQEAIFEDVSEYAQSITGDDELKKTFVLNALVGLDNAAWLLYAAENGFESFDQMIPEAYCMVLRKRHAQVAAIPLISYGMPLSEIHDLAAAGSFFMKIKLGRPGSQDVMLQKDKERLLQIHQAIGAYETPYTQSGRLLYYIDANGRYESKETLLQLLDFADSIGALEQIALIEEPFPEEIEITVQDLPVRLAADESAHTEHDTLRRIEMGYAAIALKPIAKTLSMSLKIAKTAYIHNVPCFCADLTVNPILVDWNKNVAARLDPFPGLANIGLLESNGRQNYRDWERLLSYHPAGGASWIEPVGGVYRLDDHFYRQSGGILAVSPHYESLVKNGLFEN